MSNAVIDGIHATGAGVASRFRRNGRWHGAATVAIALWLSGGVSQQTVSTQNQGFYSAAQAGRGKAVYERSCAGCHSIAAAAKPDAMPIPLAGAEFQRRFRTVGDLFAKSRATMPANNAGGLTPAAYADVTAYLLQVNGLPQGPTDLPSNLDQLHGSLLSGARAQATAGTGVTNLADTGHYTREQAARGSAYFLGNCATCHAPSPQGYSEGDAAIGRKGVVIGSVARQFNVMTPGFQRYPNVFALFTKVRRGMPAHDPGTLSLQTYLDITAFLLQAKGAPAGASELQYNVNAMKSMTLNEPGFEKLFNGKDWTGIKFVIGTNCAPQPAGCAQTTAGRAASIRDGLIVTDGGPEGYFYFDKKFLEFTLRFDMRHLPYPDQETDADYVGGGGFMLFVTDHRVWPRGLEMEGSGRGLLGGNALDGQAKVALDADARRRAMNPIGQWNAIEIVSKGGTVTGSLNGTPVVTITELSYKEPGYIAFQIQDARSEWRNIRIKAE